MSRGENISGAIHLFALWSDIQRPCDASNITWLSMNSPRWYSSRKSFNPLQARLLR